MAHTVHLDTYAGTAAAQRIGVRSLIITNVARMQVAKSGAGVGAQSVYGAPQMHRA